MPLPQEPKEPSLNIPAKRAPAPPPPERWYDTDTPGVQRSSDGRHRTNLPLPK